MAKKYIDNLSEEVTKGMVEKAEQGMWPSYAPLGGLNRLLAALRWRAHASPDALPGAHHPARLPVAPCQWVAAPARRQLHSHPVAGQSGQPLRNCCRRALQHRRPARGREGPSQRADFFQQLHQLRVAGLWVTGVNDGVSALVTALADRPALVGGAVSVAAGPRVGGRAGHLAGATASRSS